MVGNVCPATTGFCKHEAAELDGKLGESLNDPKYEIHCCKNCGSFYLTEEENVSQV